MALSAKDIETLYMRHAQRLLGFLVARTLNPDAAVELHAETFAQAFLGRERFRGDPNLAGRAWLYGIATNLLREYFRDGRIERRALQRLGVEPQPLSHEEYDRVEDALAASTLRDALADELSALTPEQRRALQLRIVQQRPYPEVARVLGISEQAARARVSRALAALRRSPTFSDLTGASEDG